MSEKVRKTVVRRRRLGFQLPIPALPQRQGTLLVCGQGLLGQLGLGMNAEKRKEPTIVPSIKDIVDIKAGGWHSLCLTATGEVYSFGCNEEGALGRYGSQFVPAKVALPSKAVKISAGDSHSACLLADGRIFAWGSFYDFQGHMGLTLEGIEPFPIEVLPGILCCDVASGSDHIVMLTCSGLVYTIGCGQFGQLGRVSLRTASGKSRTGMADMLKPGILPIHRFSKADRIWASSCCTFVKEYLKPNIHGCGLNNFKQLGIIKTVNTVISPVRNKFSNVKTISGGLHHTLVLTEDNVCYAIGRGDHGRLGLGSSNENVEELQPVRALDGKLVVDVSCGEAESFAITDDGKLYAWGRGWDFHLGTGNEDDVMEPVLINSEQTKDKKFIKVSSGAQHTLFLIENEEEEEKTDLNENQTKKKRGSQPEELESELKASKPKKGRKK